MKYKLQQETVKKIVEQLGKGGKVEFDSSLMTVEEFSDCFRAAKSQLENKNPLKSGANEPKVNLPEGEKGAGK